MAAKRRDRRCGCNERNAPSRARPAPRASWLGQADSRRLILTARVLVVHNRYRSTVPSGENRAVEQQILLLRSAGIQVETYFRSSDEIEGFGPLACAGLALRPIYSREDVHAFRRAIANFRPEVVHLHNPYPLISPAIVRVAHSAGIPVVQAVHNFRHVCASGVFFRDGRVCEDCRETSMPWPAVAHGCYRGSRAQSAVMATSLIAHRSTWKLVDRFLPVSDFVADFLAEIGVPRERITVVPNALPDPGPPVPPGDGFLFAGRLDPEKGVGLLLNAWEQSNLGSTTTLTIAGDGPLRQSVESAAARLPGIRFEGFVSSARVRELLRACRVLVLPSLWYEALPTIVLEAFAAGRPVLATTVRTKPGLVDEGVGWHAPPDPSALAAAARAVHVSESVDALGHEARRRYETIFAPERVRSAMVNLYSDVILRSSEVISTAQRRRMSATASE